MSMSFQTCKILYPLLLNLAKQTPGAAAEFMKGIWPQLVGPQMALKSQPAAWEGDTLTIEVVSESWKQVLETMSEELCQRINVFCGSNALKHLQFEIGFFPEARDSGRPVIPARRHPTERS